MKMPRLVRGCCLEAMAQMATEGAQFDALITDPPYHLRFMNKQWDGGDVAFRPETWRLAYDLLKPGAHLLAFGATRTFHRMVCAIEDGGFDVRDTIMWMYSTGFPKSHNLAGKWQGWGTALKPAYEPILVARKPLEGTVARNVTQHGTGALNIEASRVDASAGRKKVIPNFGGGFGGIGGSLGSKGGGFTTEGRWPANVVHDGSDEVLAEFAKYGESSPGHTSARGVLHSGRHGGLADIGGNIKPGTNSVRGYNDSGGTAARFFYSVKATAADRADSKHPTVKPLALMRYLCTLVTPPNGVILDPFAGSGTTIQAAIECGFEAVGIEREPEYQADIQRRLDALDANKGPSYGKNARQKTAHPQPRSAAIKDLFDVSPQGTP